MHLGIKQFSDHGLRSVFVHIYLLDNYALFFNQIFFLEDGVQVNIRNDIKDIERMFITGLGPISRNFSGGKGVGDGAQFIEGLVHLCRRRPLFRPFKAHMFEKVRDSYFDPVSTLTSTVVVGDPGMWTRTTFKPLDNLYFLTLNILMRGEIEYSI